MHWAKKLVLVLAIAVLVTNDGKKVVKVPFIYYPVYFQKGQR